MPRLTLGTTRPELSRQECSVVPADRATRDRRGLVLAQYGRSALIPRHAPAPARPARTAPPTPATRRRGGPPASPPAPRAAGCPPRSPPSTAACPRRVL